jgi:uncharacterized protein with PQ loop repeat
VRADVVSLLALLATAVSVVVVLPQVWRTCRYGRTGGIALGHVWLAVVTSAVWVQFGLHAGATGAAANAAVTGVLNAVLLVGLARALPAVLRQAVLVVPAAGAWLAAHGLLLAAGEVATVGALTAVGSAVGALPQVVLLLRRPDLDWSGVSTTSWQLSAVTSACWLGYWALLGESVLVVSPTVGLAAALTVLLLLANARAGRRHPVAVLAERRARVRPRVFAVAARS